MTSHRWGDLTHEQLGDVEVECPECFGAGVVRHEDPTAPWHLLHERECERCRGWGTVWKEGEE